MRYRHKKRGTVYEILTTEALMQCATREHLEREFESKFFTVYRSVESRHVWVRPTEEFMDGRFEELRDESP